MFSPLPRLGIGLKAVDGAMPAMMMVSSNLIPQLLGAVSEFDQATRVAKLLRVRRRKRRASGEKGQRPKFRVAAPRSRREARRLPMHRAKRQSGSVPLQELRIYLCTKVAYS
jgi:hypothetical protein